VQILSKTCLPKCGDGEVDLGEDCDDGDLLRGNGCSSDCKKEGEVSVDLT